MQLRQLFMCAGLACAVLSSGCTSIMSEVIAAKQNGSEGLAVEYPVTENQAWDIAKTVLREAGAQAIEEHRAENYMLTTSPNTLGVSGALVGVWISKGGVSTSTVTVITKRQIKSALFVAPTEAKLQSQFAQAVAQLHKNVTYMLVPPDAKPQS
ncbi:MAG: hypothetical protein ABIP34_20915 [Rhodoferax sp.]|uniref:hypothetical protein n=1 Tax=Rhodoferax sp. TaxID=50421 RepID=UPI003265DB45